MSSTIHSEMLESRRLFAAGALDPTFNISGLNSTDINHQFESVASAALQADGKILVVGTTGSNASVATEAAVARYNTDGTLDSTFGTGGILQITVPGSSSSHGVGIGELANGQLIVGGFATFGTDLSPNFNLFLTRLNAGGGTDASYGSGGTSVVDLGGTTETASAFLLTADAHVYLAGSDGVSSFLVARFNSAGSLDNSFGTNGVATTVVGADATISAIALDGAQRVVAAGSTGGTAADFAVARYTSAGLADATFASAGLFTNDFGGAGLKDEALAVAIQPDGKILAAGVTNESLPRNGLSRYAILRLSTAGVLDTGFATGGKYTSSPSGSRYQQLDAIAVLANGQIVAAGTSGDPAAPAATVNAINSDVSVIRLTSSGGADITFSGGESDFDYNGQFDEARALLPMADGRLVVVSNVGNTSNQGGGQDLGIARLTADPSLSYNATIFDAVAAQQGQSVTFTVTLDRAATSSLSIAYTTVDGTAVAGTDYTPSSGTVTFAAGETSHTITVPTLVSATNTSGRRFSVTLSPTAGVTFGNATGTATVLGATQSAPLPALSISNVTLGEPALGTNTSSAVFTVTLSFAAAGPVTVDYATSGVSATEGSDYTHTSGTLTIPAGSTTGTITVPILLDYVNEANESFVVTLSNPSGATLSNDVTGIGTITNTETPTPTATAANVTVSEPAPGQSASANFTVTLDHPFGSDVQLGYSTSDGTARDGTDYTAVTGTLTIQAGATTGTISVPILRDADSELDTSFELGLSAISNVRIDSGRATATIVNTASTVALPVVSITSAVVAEPPVGGTRVATFTVSLDKAGTSDITLDYGTIAGTASAGTDFTAVNGTLTFSPGETTKTITVPILADTAVETDETFSVVLGNPSGAVVPTGTIGTGTITNTPVTVTLPVISVAGGSITEGLANRSVVNFTFTLSAAYSDPVSVSYATADGTATAGSDYVATSGTVTFAPGQTSITLPVVVLGDITTEQAETLTLNLSAPSNATLAATSATATISDATFTTLTFTGTTKPKLSFVDAGGVTVTVTLSGPGSGTIYRQTGNNSAGLIVLTGTTTKSKLTIATPKNTFTTVGAIRTDGALGGITAAGTTLIGDLTVPGGLSAATLHGVSGTAVTSDAIISLGGVAGSYTLGGVSDVVASFAVAPKSLSVLSWTNTDGTADTITAPSFATVKATVGNFNGSLTASSGGIASFSVKGAITGGTTTANGTIKSVTAAALSNTTINAAIDLTTLSIKGAITNSTIRAGGTIKSLTAGSLVNSRVLAGVPVTTSVLPVTAAPFASVSSSLISKLTLNGKVGDNFSGSIIAAPNLGAITLGRVATGGAASGVAANVAKSLSYQPTGVTKAIKVSNVNATNVASGNFAIRVF